MRIKLNYNLLFKKIKEKSIKNFNKKGDKSPNMWYNIFIKQNICQKREARL